ncbi:hypothetical protein NE237_017872 [Protea cynaroides]|uniref:Uncharacterized protein n=1 Tax=Protea cynaroides TaxID=273540 RepID=A0A9Q0K8U5_9MAGN|nr:hypothetical protein NE237_017872 [Protea cynaroides]
MEISLLDQSPSFNNYSCDMLAEIPAKVVKEFNLESFQDNMEEEFEPPPPLLSQSINDEPQQQEQNEDEDHEDDDDEDDKEDDFEFAVVGKDSDLSPIPADKIFDNGQIRPDFLIFNRALLFADGTKSDFKPNDNPPCSSSFIL